MDKHKIDINRVKFENEYFFKISNNDFMHPFFMTIVSDSNHWMFISSNGGLTAGRKNAEHALFPYYTDDKIMESQENTGSKSIVHVRKDGKSHIWEPFSIRSDGFYDCTRNLYKSVYGNKILFEEINNDLGLAFRYQWNSSNLYGFVRRAWLENQREETVQISLLDGIQNILPAGVGSDLQNSTSNLVDAYKRSELEESSGLGIYALSAIIVDRAEPSEALKANIAWSMGFDDPVILLSSKQLKNFRKKIPLKKERDIKAERGAYFIQSDFNLQGGENKEWIIVADVNASQSDIAKLINEIKVNKELEQEVLANVKLGTQKLVELNASSDGIQLTADKYRDARNFSNSLFNIMRGGVFDHNYEIEKWDLLMYLANANHQVVSNNQEVLDSLPENLTSFKLRELAQQADDKDLKRLCHEYLPLKFSRRHGDPSRPWNKFSINTRSEIDGSKILDYEGNWRDIFQNWEALAQSFPAFIENMIHKFLNASTFEGYNPYRVNKNGFDWETIHPDDPWSYIGYWGDHQIIYLLKLMEMSEKHFPGDLKKFFADECFVYANIPYKIKSYTQILENPKDTIDFDEALDKKLREKMQLEGSDAAILRNESGEIYYVNFIEKILASVLAKMSNFIMDGGIWMNTQRPEWNDANNALVGNGVSMVTLYYLRRFLMFFKNLLGDLDTERTPISNELIIFYKHVRSTLEEYQPLLSEEISDETRKKILDSLGQAASDYRNHIYERSFWGEKRTVSYKGIKRFIDLGLEFIDHSISRNKRKDHLYHAYNLMTIDNNQGISISHLSKMLEGQVAVLSSGYLSLKESLEVLDALKQSNLFRHDQYSYLLYPSKSLKGFLHKNIIPKQDVEHSVLLRSLASDENKQIIEQDVNGNYHFNGNFKNAADLNIALKELKQSNEINVSEEEYTKVFQIFEKVFNHKAFTGRSGTFYGYEGLGSIYWHMVSKLQLAVQEVCSRAERKNANPEIFGRLLEHYYEINEGIGVHKSPELYGAFPTDAYSHTPHGRGAQQPGMTGQVKEDLLCRFGELGVFVKDGQLHFHPFLLQKSEFTTKPRVFNYVDIFNKHKQLDLETSVVCFTYCQVPVIYKTGDEKQIDIHLSDGSVEHQDILKLDRETSEQIFNRTGAVNQIVVHVLESELK